MRRMNWEQQNQLQRAHRGTRDVPDAERRRQRRLEQRADGWLNARSHQTTALQHVRTYRGQNSFLVKMQIEAGDPSWIPSPGQAAAIHRIITEQRRYR